jgi:hypothetical protein
MSTITGKNRIMICRQRLTAQPYQFNTAAGETLAISVGPEFRGLSTPISSLIKLLPALLRPLQSSDQLGKTDNAAHMARAQPFATAPWGEVS